MNPPANQQPPLPQPPARTLEPFTWLFVAFFADGTTVEQNAEDTSKTRTDGTGSSFTDVRERIEAGDKLTHFELRHIDGDKVVTVDLTTGAFMANGIPMHLHNQFFEPDKYPLKLVYFRETRVDQEHKGTVQDDLSVKRELVGNPRHYVNRYFMGWETSVNGKSKQQTIAVG